MDNLHLSLNRKFVNIMRLIYKYKKANKFFHYLMRGYDMYLILENRIKFEVVSILTNEMYILDVT